MNNQLNYIIEQAEDLPINSLNQCINCGAYLPNEYATKCLICGYDSAEQFECPYKVNKRVQLSNANVDLCKHDWDSLETSWDFKKHPLV